MVAAVASLLGTEWAIAQGREPTSEKSSRSPNGPPTELPRLEPLSIEAAMDAFEIADGYRIELVASEPLVVDPVAFCFDSRGRLVVAEMVGYSERSDANAGRVVRLTDSDGDGRMDRREVLLEGLSWPTAVACFEDGVMVAAAPDLFWLAEGQTKPERLIGGFGKSNVQGLVNSLRWGLDLQLHGATSSSSGNLTGGGQQEPLAIGRRDFRIAPESRRLQAVDGGGQHGMMIDPWGDKYVCSNSDHLQQVWMLPARPHRSDRTSTLPPRRRSIAADGPQAEVFRSSPVEPWRILRTHMRVTGQASGPIEGGGRAAGYFTGATGVYVYDGDQWPEADDPVALVCDVGSNLVHRKWLREDGLWRRGERMDEGTEFLRSRDIWFRPVQLGTGPDGALYIADMYREVIEHPKSLPPLIKRQVDLNSGNNRGRIWRVVADDRPLRRVTEPLDQAEVPALIARLDHPNQWQRRTAGRLLLEPKRRTLVERASAVEHLRTLVREGQHAEGRLQALAVLVRLEQLRAHATPKIKVGETKTPESYVDAETWHAVLSDSHQRVRQRGLEWLAAGTEHKTDDISKSPAFISTELARRLADDPSIHVRFQLAYDAGALVPDPLVRAEILQRVAIQNPADAWIRWAVEGSLGEASGPFVQGLLGASETGALASQKWRGQQADWLAAACYQWVRGTPGRVAGPLVEYLQTADPQAVERLLPALAEAMEGVRVSDDWQPLTRWIVARLSEPTSRGEGLTEWSAESRGARLRLVRWADEMLPQRYAPETITRWLRPEFSAAIQRDVLEHLVGDQVADFEAVAECLDGLTPAVQSQALDRLCRTKIGMAFVAEQILGGQIPPEAATRATRDRLVEYTRLSPEDFAVTVADATFTEQEFERYRQALLAEETRDVKVNAEAGLATFKRLCSTCHRVGDVGNQVGPDLKSLVSKSETQILLSIMDPNREIDPRYRLVQMETVDGRILSGILTAETETELLLVDGQAKSHRIARDEIETLQTTNRSLMPAGLAKEITPAQMRDLIGLLQESR